MSGYIRVRFGTILAGCVCAMISAPLVGANEEAGRRLFQSRCASCHIVEPAEPSDYVELANRRGPSLAYAGSKFDAKFLTRWLVSPTQIRPAGYIPFRQVVSTADGDRLDISRISPHLRLSMAEAAVVSDYLRALRKPSQQYPIAQANSDIDATIHFTKVLGCASCHRTQPDAGGISGPELYTVAARLNKDWLTQLVADPVYWGPMAMPKPNIRSDQLATITEYLFSLAASPTEYPTGATPPANGRTAKPATRVQAIYEIFCSQCHGITGNGKGINAPMMFVSPRNHTSAQEMGPLTDDRLYAVIRYGGTAVGKSVLMPSWGAVLKDADIRLLVSYLRELSGTQTQAGRSQTIEKAGI